MKVIFALLVLLLGIAFLVGAFGGGGWLVGIAGAVLIYGGIKVLTA
jgi:hypothetical protein